MNDDNGNARTPKRRQIRGYSMRALHTQRTNSYIHKHIHITILDIYWTDIKWFKGFIASTIFIALYTRTRTVRQCMDRSLTLHVYCVCVWACEPNITDIAHTYERLLFDYVKIVDDRNSICTVANQCNAHRCGRRMDMHIWTHTHTTFMPGAEKRELQCTLCAKYNVIRISNRHHCWLFIPIRSNGSGMVLTWAIWATKCCCVVIVTA